MWREPPARPPRRTLARVHQPGESRLQARSFSMKILKVWLKSRRTPENPSTGVVFEGQAALSRRLSPISGVCEASGEDSESSVRT